MEYLLDICVVVWRAWVLHAENRWVRVALAACVCTIVGELEPLRRPCIEALMRYGFRSLHHRGIRQFGSGDDPRASRRDYADLGRSTFVNEHLFHVVSRRASLASNFGRMTAMIISRCRLAGPTDARRAPSPGKAHGKRLQRRYSPCSWRPAASSAPCGYVTTISITNSPKTTQQSNHRSYMSL